MLPCLHSCLHMCVELWQRYLGHDLYEHYFHLARWAAVEAPVPADRHGATPRSGLEIQPLPLMLLHLRRWRQHLDDLLLDASDREDEIRLWEVPYPPVQLPIGTCLAGLPNALLCVLP